MNRSTLLLSRRSRRLEFVAGLLAATILLSGCAKPTEEEKARGYSNFKRPKMPPVPAYVATPIDGELQTKALGEISAASKSNDEVMRAQALEASSRTQDPTASDRVARALTDDAWLVRFAGAMCAGDLKLRAAYKPLLATAYDKQPSVRVAVRYALHRLGDKSLTKDLEALSQNPDPRVRANVAMVLGQLGEPTGVRVLRPLMADPDFSVRIQASEALWRLGDEQGLKNLVAGSISHHPDDQIVSVLALAAPRDQRVKDNIVGKLAISKDGEDYVELQLAAARAMGMLGGDEGYGIALKSLNSRDPRQRSLAALALGEIGRSDAQAPLAKSLSDQDAEVRLSSAVALRQIDLKARGLTNKTFASN